MKKLIFFYCCIGLSICVFSQEKTEISKQTFTYKDTLQLDFYAVKKDSLHNKPLVILVHGGGFGYGKRDNKTETSFCKTMANKGFVVASISYRLTRKNKSFGCDCPTEKKVEAFVKSAEDIISAVQFIHAQNELQFDRNTNILIGSSAGAEAALHTVFMLDDYRFKHIDKFKFSGIISMSGALMNTEYITKKNAIPALFFHGTKDNLVPYKTAPHHLCDSSSDGYIILEGSKSITDKLQQINTSYILGYATDGKHDWANIAYQKTNEIAYFIEELILSKKFVQLSYGLKK